MASTHTSPANGAQPSSKPQYHHFIPRFILRNFVRSPNRSSDNDATPSSHKQKNKDGKLQVIDTCTGNLESLRLSQHYGQLDMYIEPVAPNEYALEEAFSRLESRVGGILDRVMTKFQEPSKRFDISRTNKDDLRKFLFLMKYRNSRFSNRFNVATIDDYLEDDKDKLSAYMRSHGYSSPRQVWLANMHAFLDTKMDPDREWHKTIQTQAYKDDALLFITHIEQSYMAFCTPQSVGDEFLLTDNVFGIHEGPTSLSMDAITGETKTVWTEWHNFAPISPSLMIILRNIFLPPDIPGGVENRDAIYQLLLDMHSDPEQSHSILEDLPIRRCKNSYSRMQRGVYNTRPGVRAYSARDRFTFEAFDLDSSQVHRINGVILEEAMQARYITYTGSVAITRSISAYLEDPQAGFKIVLADNDSRHKYLKALQIALTNLGGSAHMVFKKPDLRIEVRLYSDYADHVARGAAMHTLLDIMRYQPG